MDRVALLHGNLVDPLPEAVNLIVANPPYVSNSEFAVLNPEITEFEPIIALAGGKDGLQSIKELIAKSGGKLLSPGAFLLEIGHNQGQAVFEMAKKYFPESMVSIITDLNGLERVVKILVGC